YSDPGFGVPPLGVCRKNEFLCANSVMLCDSVVKLPGKTFTTKARSLHKEPRRTFSDRLLKESLYANSVMLCDSVVKLPEKHSPQRHGAAEPQTEHRLAAPEEPDV